MHIVHVTAEMAPIAKVGGLGDVVTGLARSCLMRGHTVDVFLPFYECINKQQIKELTLTSTYESYYDGSWIPTNVYRGVVFGIPVVFIEPSNDFFKGQSVYGGSYNELEAYLFFTRACLEWLQVSCISKININLLSSLSYYDFSWSFLLRRRESNYFHCKTRFWIFLTELKVNLFVGLCNSA